MSFDHLFWSIALVPNGLRRARLFNGSYVHHHNLICNHLGLLLIIGYENGGDSELIL